MLPKRAFLMGLLLCLALPAAAQWSTQTIVLHPGWNAVYLEVQPSPNATTTVFSGIAVESVWEWNRRFNTVQYIQDPNTLVPQQPEWLKFFPAETPNGFLSNLNAIQGGRSYLVKLGGAEDVTLQVTGQPVYRPGEWLGDSFNLAGFHVTEGGTLTFAQYFAQSDAHKNEKMLKLDPSGAWTQFDPAQQVIQPGVAYWVYTRGESTYRGPSSVKAENSYRLDYGRALEELNLTFTNTSGTVKTFTLAPQNSVPPPDPAQPLLAGSVPLAWFNMQLSSLTVQWEGLDQGATFEVAAGQEKTIRIGVRRADFADFLPPTAQDDFLYQSILRVTDGAGLRMELPVSAEGLRQLREDLPQQAKSTKATLEEMFGDPHAGLWYGYVGINKVSEPRNAADGPLVPQPTANDFVFPILVHVDYDGNVKLLQHATVMWKDGTTQPAAENQQLQEVAEAGRYVVVVNDTLLNQFQGASMRDGTPVGRRFASANFSHREPAAMNGVFGESLAVELTLSYSDPLNPFKHKYHPDHNMDTAIPTVRSDGSASEWFTVTRQISIEFTDTDPESTESARWGDQLMGGYYRETLIGLHQKTLFTEGLIRLTRVLTVGVLNDGIE